MKLGTILRSKGLITGTRLVKALDRQKLHGGRLGRILVDQGWIPEEELVLALHAQFQTPIIDLAKAPFNTNALGLVPEPFAVAEVVLPITFINVPEGCVLVVAMEDPANHTLIEQIHQATGYPIKPMLSGRKALLQAIAGVYHQGSSSSRWS